MWKYEVNFISSWSTRLYYEREDEATCFKKDAFSFNCIQLHIYFM